jgi:replicative DNA helicase
MKRLLKGIIDFRQYDQEVLAQNFHRLRDAKLEFPHPADEKVFRFVSDFFESELCMPSARVLVDYYTKTEDHETIERLKDIKGAANYEGANYSYVLKEIREAQGKLRLLTHLKEISEVAKSGKTIKVGRDEIRYEGLDGALQYMQERDVYEVVGSTDIVPAMTVTDLREATHESWAEFREAMENPGASWGLLSGIEPIDEVCHGLKPGELWVHAAATGELKSTLAENVAYNAVTRYRAHVVYVSLERTIKQHRTGVHCLHGMHPRFRHLPGDLSYRRVRAGVDENGEPLSQEERDLYQEVLRDFRENPDYTQMRTITPNESITVGALRRKLTQLNREMEIGLVVIDHSELLQPAKRTHNHGEDVNSIYHELMALSLQFDGGRGVPVLALHQINRAGKDKAMKEGGRYVSSSVLSWANAAERDASLVTWSYLDDDLRAAARARVGCLKNRDNPPFPDFELDIHWATKRLTVAPRPELESAQVISWDEADAILDRLNTGA